MLDAYREVPGASELQKIVRVGARALDWVDLLQKDIPPLEREQIWRRVDRIGHEHTPDNPNFYNPELILEQYRKATAEAPAEVTRVLFDAAALPAVPPAGA